MSNNIKQAMEDIPIPEALHERSLMGIHQAKEEWDAALVAPKRGNALRIEWLLPLCSACSPWARQLHSTRIFQKPFKGHCSSFRESVWFKRAAQIRIC